MPHCLNPTCQKPQNPDGTKFCIRCGTKLVPLLRGRYLIISALSQGGFGKTYLAEDEDRRKAICVVKQFSPLPAIYNSAPALQKAIELFNQEAERLLHLEDHPQIPTLFAYFEQDSYLYLVQQFIKGPTLLEELQQQGTFSEVKIKELLNDLLPVLQFVHSRQVIHRDIKPENIIRRQSDNKLILIDFGVSKQMSGTLLTQQGTLLGTPGYAPMEQAMRGVAYPASDLYSLAVTCIRLMTGIFPNLTASDELYDPVEACWLWREKLPSGTTVSIQLGEILDKLLKDYVKDRYQSAEDVLAALNAQPAAPTTENQPRKFAPVVGTQYQYLHPSFSNGEEFMRLLLRLNPVADAVLSSYFRDTNYDKKTQLSAGTWTMSGEPNIVRSLLKFDIPPEPEDYKLLCAKLFLFAETTTPMYGQGQYNSEAIGHSQLSGSNEWCLSPVLSAWSEGTVTWANQPKTMSVSQFMPASRSPSQDYEDIDITDLVRLCLDEKINFGFLMKLKTESHWREVTFHSRKTESLDLRPRLDLYYIKPATN